MSKHDTIFVVNGCSNHSEKTREKNDYYATEPNAMKKFLEVYKDIDKNVWECACGELHLSNVLAAKGYNVRNSDIVDRLGDGSIEVLDFLNQNEKWDGDIITNPPYKNAKEFIEKAMDCIEDGHKVIMFLKLTFLESQSRRSMFKKCPLKYLYVSSSRLQTSMNGDFEKYKATAVAFGWYVFEKGYQGEPIIRWFN